MRRGRKASSRGGGVSKGPGAGRQAAQVIGACMRLRDTDRAPVDEVPKLGSSDQLTGSRISGSSLLPFVPSVGGQVQ